MFITTNPKQYKTLITEYLEGLAGYIWDYP